MSRVAGVRWVTEQVKVRSRHFSAGGMSNARYLNTLL
jgi:hypothetical protein